MAAFFTQTGLCYLMLGIAACAPVADQKIEIGGYDLSAPEKYFMPESLFEISGITFKNGQNDTVYAVQDEEGKLFRLAPGVKKQLHTRFGKDGDYEDLAILGERIYILKSNGSFLTLPLNATSEEKTDEVAEWSRLLPKGEFEGLAAVEAANHLYVLCKDCKKADQKESVSGYIITPGEPPSLSGTFNIRVSQIREKTGTMKAPFKPSGLARNPLTKDWYILSAVNKLLVVTDPEWQVKEAVHLPGGMFAQPEGIAFDRSGDLYISNEGSDTSEGNILRFKTTAQRSPSSR